MSDESAAAAAKPAKLGQVGPDGGDSGSGAPSEDGVRLYLVEGLRVRAHPLAEAFPLLSDSEIATLAGDITRYGQQELVKMQITKEGVKVVLDGRNRLLACERAGIVPKIAYLPRGMDPAAYIVSMHFLRRHMTPSQRALVAARMVTLTVSGRPSTSASIEAISQPKAGDLMHVGRSQVQRAGAILGDEILEPVVEAGLVAVSDAYEIRTQKDEAKRRAVAAVRSGEARTLRAAVADLTAGPRTSGSAGDASGRPASAAQKRASGTGVPVQSSAPQTDAGEASGGTFAVPGQDGESADAASPGKKRAERPSAGNAGGSRSGLSLEQAHCDDLRVNDLRAFIMRVDTVTGTDASTVIRDLSPEALRAVLRFVGALASAMVDRLQKANGEHPVGLGQDLVPILQQVVVGLSRRGDSAS